MPDKGTSTFADDDAATDGEIMTTLLVTDAPRLWSVEEIVREVGDEPAVTDSLNRLHGGGLIHRLGGFVFPTRAAVCSHQLAR